MQEFLQRIERDEEIVKELQDRNQSHIRAENQDSQDHRHLPICL
jgi:putative resolvase